MWVHGGAMANNFSTVRKVRPPSCRNLSICSCEYSNRLIVKKWLWISEGTTAVQCKSEVNKFIIIYIYCGIFVYHKLLKAVLYDWVIQKIKGSFWAITVYYRRSCGYLETCIAVQYDSHPEVKYDVLSSWKLNNWVSEVHATIGVKPLSHITRLQVGIWYEAMTN